MMTSMFVTIINSQKQNVLSVTCVGNVSQLSPFPATFESYVVSDPNELFASYESCRFNDR